MNTINADTPLRAVIYWPKGVNGSPEIKVEYERIDRSGPEPIQKKSSTTLSNILLALNLNLEDGSKTGRIVSVPTKLKNLRRLSNQALLLGWLGAILDKEDDPGTFNIQEK